MRSLLQLFALIMGFSGQVAQMVLVREFLVFVLGQEFYVGILLSNWLLLEAIGSMISSKIFGKHGDFRTFIILHIIFSFFLVVSILKVRCLKVAFGVSIGEPLTFTFSFFSSLILVFFVSLIHGMLFPFLCKLFSDDFAQESSISGKIYALETIGTVIAGIFLSFFLLLYLNPLTIVLFLSIINLLASILLVELLRERFSKAFKMVLWGIFILFFFLIAFSGTLHRGLLKVQWKDLNLVHYENSKYGNLSVARVEDQYIIFQNGFPSYFLPYPDMTEIEELVHIPLLSHKEPKDILLLGFGPGGGITEVLRHKSVKSVDYVELDPALIKVFQKLKMDMTELELSNPKVNVNYIDGRLFLKETGKRYDLILSGIKSPSTLSSNRFFTKEFFEMVRERLKPDGIFLLGINFSFRYSVEENLKLIGSVYYPIETIFEHVRVLPKEKVIVLLCSRSDSVIKLDRELLIQRLKERKLTEIESIPRYVEERLHAGWRRWFQFFLKAEKGQENRDTRPIAVFYSILLDQSIVSPKFAKFLKIFDSVSFRGLIIILIFLIASVLLSFFIFKKRPSHLINIPIVTTGFYGMAVELLVIFSFQSLLGYVYHWIAILTSIYMLGCATGAHLGSISSSDLLKARKSFLFVEILIIASCILFPLVISKSGGLRSAISINLLLSSISFFSGLLTGYEFPLAVRIYLGQQREIEYATGILYGSDLLGGFLAGFFTGFILLPVFGLEKTFLFLLSLKLASLATYVIQFIFTKGTNGER